MRISIPESNIISGPVDTGIRSTMGQVLLETQRNEPVTAYLDFAEVENRNPFGREVVTISVKNGKGEVSKFVVTVNINNQNQAEATLIAIKNSGETRKKAVANWRKINTPGEKK